MNAFCHLGTAIFRCKLFTDVPETATYDAPNTVIVPLGEIRAANSVDFFIEFKFEFNLFYEFEFSICIFASLSSSLSPVKIYQVLSSLEKSNYLEHVQMKINSSFLKVSSSLNSSSLPIIFASLSSSSSSQLRLFLSSMSKKRSSSFEFTALVEMQFM